MSEASKEIIKRVFESYDFINAKASICPVCNGRGIVPNGFYNSTSNTWITSTTVPETCRSCNGKGYVKIYE